MATEVRDSEMHQEHQANLYHEEFDPIRSDKGDLDLAGLGMNVDQNQESLRSVKMAMEDWRLVLLPLMRFLRWEQVWFPGVIFGLNSFFFLLIWYLDLSFLSTLALVATLLAFADAIVPILAANLLSHESWTAQEEAEFDGVCQNMLNMKARVGGIRTRLHQLKLQYPRVFSIGLCAVCLFAAVAFDRVDNFFLVYLMSTLVLLSPGLMAKNVYSMVHAHSRNLVHTIKSKTIKKQA